MHKTWFNILNKAEDETEIYIYDEIGSYGITAKEFIDEFNLIKTDKVVLRINSPGGDVFQGNAIFSVLSQSDKKITAYVDGVAASMASVIALAADETFMPENGFLMIHNPYAGAIGEAKDLRATANLLDKIRASISNIYQRRTGKSAEEIDAMMDATTWMSGREAMDNNFITGLIPAIAVSQCASTDTRILENAPDGVLAWIKDAPVVAGVTTAKPEIMEMEKDMDLKAQITDLSGELAAIMAERDEMLTKINQIEKDKAAAEAVATIEAALAGSGLPETAKEKIRKQYKGADDTSDIHEAIEEMLAFISELAPRATQITDLGPSVKAKTEDIDVSQINAFLHTTPRD